jgi:hypothetical protein
MLGDKWDEHTCIMFDSVRAKLTKVDQAKLYMGLT